MIKASISHRSSLTKRVPSFFGFSLLLKQDRFPSYSDELACQSSIGIYQGIAVNPELYVKNAPIQQLIDICVFSLPLCLTSEIIFVSVAFCCLIPMKIYGRGSELQIETPFIPWCLQLKSNLRWVVGWGGGTMIPASSQKTCHSLVLLTDILLCCLYICIFTTFCQVQLHRKKQ